MGFGIAIALALDATLVRLLVIPAAMRLLGERNWYLPRWLAWLPDMQVEGRQPGPPVPAVDGVEFKEPVAGRPSPDAGDRPVGPVAS
jgi:hypothetical protein